MKRNTKRAVAGFLAAVAVAGGFGWWMFFSAINANHSSSYLYVDADDNLDSVYVKMKPTAGAGSMLGVRMGAKLLGLGKRLKPGRYAMGPDVSTLQLLRSLRSGLQVPVKLTIPVTHTVQMLAGRLSKELMADSTTLAHAFTDSLLLRQLDVDTATVPCLFLQDTYEVYWDISPEKLLRRMKQEHDAYWTPERVAKAQRLGLKPDEVFTLASIVERESANEAERPAIAGMYLNRLKQGMKLQADPTVKFALRNFALRRIMHNHLLVDSPYNTYLHPGLPAGPISIPSKNAIESVLNAQKHAYIYMCAKEDFSGTHNFAETYEEHMKNARRYAEALNKRGVK